MQPAERKDRLTVKAGINSLGVEVMNNRDLPMLLTVRQKDHDSRRVQRRLVQKHRKKMNRMRKTMSII